MSVGVVLAVVASGPFFAPAASAVAPAAVTAPAAPAAAPIQVPFLASGGTVMGAGTAGFLTRDADGVARWTRYADGVSTVVETGAGSEVHGSASDSVVVTWPKAQRYGTDRAMVFDMANGAAPVTFSGFDGEVTGAVGSALFDDGHELHPVLSTQNGGVRTSTQVTGMTEPSHSEFRIADSLPGTALGFYRSFEPVKAEKLVVVDIAGARVVETYTAGEGATFAGAASITADRVHWAEYVDGKTVLASAKRGTAEVTRVALSGNLAAGFKGDLGGDWSVFDTRWDTTAPAQGIVARSLADGTSVKLLDHAESVMKAADGTLLAIGTTADRGTGVYRLAVKDGKPAAELVAATGEAPAPTTPIDYTGHAVPATLNLDGVAKTRLSWRFSTTQADLTVELKHKDSWRSFRTTVRPRATGVLPDGSLGFDWAGETGSGAALAAAPNGSYEWTVTARPWNGMPAATATGTFEVTRTPKAHDYTNNGSSDLFARLTDGALDVIDTRWDDATGRLVVGDTHRAPGWSGDWNGYDRVEAVGDIVDSPVFDTVARDKSGVLWLHVGTDPFTGKSPVKVGGGWQIYNQLAGGSDLTGDGRADLVAIDEAGGLFLYKATGNTSAPFEPRQKIGHGWGIYDQITATGQIGGGPAGDLVARDKDGVLWLYLGKGDGTFAPRTKIGGGWNVYADIVGIGDGDKDGRPDLYARTAAGASFFYAGTGDWKAPLKPRTTTQAGVAPSGTTYNQVF